MTSRRPDRAKRHEPRPYAERLRDYRAHIAANVHRLREQAGWSQEEAAHQCGELPTRSYQHVETARGNPTLETLMRICEGFDVSLEALIAPAAPRAKQGRGRPRKAPRDDQEPQDDASSRATAGRSPRAT